MEEIKKCKYKKAAYQLLKRDMDIVFSLIGIICLLLVFPIIATAIYLDSEGPIFFIHKRVGKYGTPLNLYKFRTMIEDAEDLKKYLNDEQLKEFEENYKLEADPRITKIGNFLRETHLDELPQILNILKGDLSVIGPRPVVSSELQKYGENKEIFLSITPGLTGYWQINGRNASYNERIEMELYYVENCGYHLDKIIFLQTVTSIFKTILKNSGLCRNNNEFSVQTKVGGDSMNNLNQLLSQSNSAKEYFMTLPEDAQGALIQNSVGIVTEEALHKKAQEILNSKSK